MTLAHHPVYAQQSRLKDLKQVLNQEKSWYSSPEAIRIADNLLLYQHDNGGWDKNINMAAALGVKEKNEIQSLKSSGETTIDNGATITQMRYLPLVYKATGNEKYKAALLKGLDYLLEAQYENGGWPQFYPIKKGYYEHITFNDDAMMGVMRLLRDIAQGKPEYSFVDSQRKTKAAKAIEKGLAVVLASQIKVDGKLTAWCAQIDKNDLSPQKARAYELPSLSGGESVGIVEYLMEIDKPEPAVVKAVEAAMNWFDQVKITGVKLIRKEDPSLTKGFDLLLVKDPTAKPLWARFYGIKTNQPMFVGRDGIVHKQLSDIEYERRVGYSYLVSSPNVLFDKLYPAWKNRWVVKK